MASILQVLHGQEAATYEQEAAALAEWAAAELKRVFRWLRKQVATTQAELERARAGMEQASAELEQAFAKPPTETPGEAQAEEELIGRLGAAYQRYLEAEHAHLEAMVALAEALQLVFAATPDHHPDIAMLREQLRAAGQIARRAHDELTRRFHQRIAERDQINATLKATEQASPHERLLALAAVREKRRILRRRWDAEDQRLRQEYLGHRTPRLRLTTTTTTTTVRARPRVAARRPGCRARQAHRSRAPASAAAGSSDGDGRPPPPPPSPPQPAPPPPPIDAHALLARLQPKLCRPTGRLLVQQMAAEPQQTLKDTHRDPSARSAVETITIWPGRIAERLHQQQRERP